MELTKYTPMRRPSKTQHQGGALSLSRDHPYLRRYGSQQVLIGVVAMYLPLQHALRGAALPASPSAVPTLRVLRARHSNLPETGTVPAVRRPTPDAIVLFEQGQMPALWRTTSSRLA
ncbi:hypothetical protein HPB49_015460 [Dermacentor silvarum]|uniref:Uncharacterized protein n=1 Tax=Dermacentor silvarum TaxID=543639 RepID=A0ACB8DE58_DERSI|nr:hypothetical protein HPB49_015460 [Dermacentor silvarum]